MKLEGRMHYDVTRQQYNWRWTVWWTRVLIFHLIAFWPTAASRHIALNITRDCARILSLTSWSIARFFFNSNNVEDWIDLSKVTFFLFDFLSGTIVHYLLATHHIGAIRQFGKARSSTVSPCFVTPTVQNLNCRSVWDTIQDNQMEVAELLNAAESGNQPPHRPFSCNFGGCTAVSHFHHHLTWNWNWITFNELCRLSHDDKTWADINEFIQTKDHSAVPLATKRLSKTVLWQCIWECILVNDLTVVLTLDVENRLAMYVFQLSLLCLMN